MPLPALLPIYTLLATFLGYAVSSLLKRIFTLLGIGAISYFGLHAVYNQLETQINNSLSGLTGDALAILGLMQFDYALSIIVSAGITKAMLAGWSSLTDSRSTFGKVKAGTL